MDFEKACLINHWPKELLELKSPAEIGRIDITKYANDILALAYDGIRSSKLDKLQDELEPHFKLPRFIRTNRRSPKDYTDGKSTISAEKAIETICNSMRVVDDIAYLLHNNEPVFIHIYPYVRQIQEKEFRCFVKDRKLIAISQYQPIFERDYLNSRNQQILKAIQAYAPTVIEPLQIDNFIFDVFMVSDGDKEIPYFLEINPWRLSDPCYFENYENVEKGGFAFQKTVIEKFD